MCKQGHISSSPWLNEWGSSPGLETTWCLSRTSFGSMTMTGRATMTGNVTRIRRATMTRNPITPVVVKVKVRRQLSCRFFQLRSFLDKEEEVGWRPCASNFVVPGCLKGQKCLGLLFNVKNQKWLSHSVTQWVISQWSVSESVTRSPIELSVGS